MIKPAVAVTLMVWSVMLASAARAADKTTWSKYDNSIPDPSNTTSTNGRIPLGTSGKGDVTHAFYQAVIKDGSTYKMWYTGQIGGTNRIYYAFSTDGLTWTKYDNNIPGASDSICTNGKIAVGISGGDSKSVCQPAVIKDDSIYKMWYAGRSETGNWRIYHATSSNGLTWTKYDNSIPDDSNTISTNGRIPLGASQGDTVHVVSPAVIKDGSIYKMWYAGHDGSKYRIYHATSSNGLTWTKYDNTIPEPSDSICTNGRIALGITGGDTNTVFFPTVIKHGSIYKMWYSGKGDGNDRIYYATSTNGLTWTKYDNSIPDDSDTTSTNGRVPLGESGGDTLCLDNPCVIKDGYFYKMWYTGRDASSVFRIYHATLDQVPEGLIFYSH